MATSAPVTNWLSVCSSADGSKLAASYTSGGIYSSTNFGAQWTFASNAPVGTFPFLTSSADGGKLVVGSHSDLVGVSTNWGTTWTTNYFSDNPSFYCAAIAASSDASRLVAARLNVSGGNGSIYTSTDSGATWRSNSVPINEWLSVASSVDGTKLVAAEGAGRIYRSTDSGGTWNQTSSSVQNWRTVASSADGNKLEAGVFLGGIWSWQSQAVPVLNITPVSSSLTVAWIVPSTNFVLQQSVDFLEWSDVTTAPVLNLTNLENEITFSPLQQQRFLSSDDSLIIQRSHAAQLVEASKAHGKWQKGFPVCSPPPP